MIKEASNKTKGHETEGPALADLLAGFIRDQGLKAHEPFPSIRDIEGKWKSTHSKTTLAIQILHERGLVYSLPRKGTFIAPTIRTREILLVAGKNPKSTLGVGQVTDFLAGVLEAVRETQAPVSVQPISYEEVACHLTDFKVAFPRAAAVLVFRNPAWLESFRGAHGMEGVPLGFYGSNQWTDRVQAVHRLLYDESEIMGIIFDQLGAPGNGKALFVGHPTELDQARGRHFQLEAGRRGWGTFPQSLALAQGQSEMKAREAFGESWESLPEKPTVIVCGRDAHALTVTHALLDLGVRIPETVQVVSIDDSFYSKCSMVPISTVRIPVYQDARLLTQAILARIPSGDADKWQGRSAVEWIERDSTRK